MPLLLTESQLAETVRFYEEAGRNTTHAAEAAGMGRTSFQTRLKACAKKGLLGFHPVVPEFEITRVSSKAEDGSWVRQVPAAENDFELPAGHIVKGISSLVDQDGKEKMKWIKTRTEDVTPYLVKALEERFMSMEPRLVLDDFSDAHALGWNDPDRQSVYVIADQHLGLLAWGKETGDPYDLAIGARRLRDCARQLVEQSPPSETALILNLGDWQHTDDSTNVTPGHKHTLDVDSRYFKIVQAGVDLMVDIIELALQKHAKVMVRNLPGNHDPHAHVALTMGLRGHYREHPRVTVIVDPMEFFYHRFGNCLIGATHGHKLKPKEMVMDMAVTHREDWAACDYRYFYFGHIHHETALEVGDVRCESFQTIASKDGYSFSHGYNSGRSLVSITLHKGDGEIGRHRVNIPPPKIKRVSQ